MKNKKRVYFACILLGAIFAAFGEKVVAKEWALLLGFVLLMFGLYNSALSIPSKEANDNPWDKTGL